MPITVTESGKRVWKEIVPGAQAIWQEDDARTYQCPACSKPVFSQHTDDVKPTTIRCLPTAHILEWEYPE